MSRMSKNAFPSAEDADTMDMGVTQMPGFNVRSCFNARTYERSGGLGPSHRRLRRAPRRASLILNQVWW
jgi:hypothetical protein